MAVVQEFDIDIRPAKLVRGQGLCKLIANNDSLDGVIFISVGEPMAVLEWYKDIIFYLRSRQFPVTMNPK